MSGSVLEPAITFLFSDIEGSTRRWEGDPEAMAEDLARHDALLVVMVTGAGGKIFSHTGDGIGAAFDTAGAAVVAAAEAQQALSRTAWAADPPLRVRMGLHTGSAQCRADNYFGPTLNRTARLMSVGAGGQVLCSQATADLLERDLPSDVGLIDLGEHRLADLARPERVFQISHAGLPSEFPPLRSLGAHRHNLPVALTSLTGRVFELKELREFLGRSRLVTVTGLGGSGKARLALQAAADAVAVYRDGVWLAELASVRDGGLVGHTLASALGLDTTGLGGSEAVTERLAGHLATKEVLLLVDNCEHLMEAAATLIQALLARCPGVVVLATSREVLGLPGEVVWPVPPLSLPPLTRIDPADLATSDAVVLFCERAKTARPDFELTAANSAEVVRICRRLDGIPLALELAAARMRVLSAGEIAERLESSFELLRTTNRAADPRLVEAGEEETAERSHCDFLLALISGWEGLCSPPGRRKRINRDDDSFRAALEWSWGRGDAIAALRILAAVWQNWLMDGQPDAREWLERVVAGTQGIEHPARVGTLCALGSVRIHEGLGGATEAFGEAIGLADKLADTPSIAFIRFAASEEALGSGDTTRARALLDQALAAFEGLGDLTGAGYCHDHLGWVAVGEADHTQARWHFERAAELARRADDDWLGAHALAALAPLAVLAGEPEWGLQLADEAVALARHEPTRFLLVMALARAAETALLASEGRRAADCLVDLFGCLSGLGTRRYLGDSLEMVALSEAARGRNEGATEMLGAAAACHEADGGASGVRLLAGEAEACRLRLEAALGTERFAAFRRQGQALSVDRAIARALDELQRSCA